MYLVVVLLVLSYLYEINFGGGDSESGAGIATSRGGAVGNHFVSKIPRETVTALYDSVANKRENNGCGLFENDLVRQKFVNAFDGADCPATMRLLNSRVTDSMSYVNKLLYPPESLKEPVGDTFVISSCAMTVTGGPKLGRFTLAKVGDGVWIISDYEAEPSCP